MNEHATAPASGADTGFDGRPNRDEKTWRGEFGALFRLGWPLIVAQLAQNALLTTDVIMIGWLGGKYLAAVSHMLAPGPALTANPSPSTFREDRLTMGIW